MKLIHIIGIIALVTISIGTASAAVVDLTPNDGSSVEHVYVIYSGNTVTFSVLPLSGQPQGWLDSVGYNVLPSTLNVIGITDNSQNGGWTYKGYNIIDSFGKFNEYTKNNGDDYGTTSVTITFSDPISDTPTFTAHVAWETGSAQFGSSTTSIPEFPLIAMPVATVLGIIFIVARKKNE
jgi:hypothetical protein